MVYFSRIFLMLFIVVLAACSTKMTAPESNFLSSYAVLSDDPNSSVSSAKLTATIDPLRLKIGEIVWRGASISNISASESGALIALLEKQLIESLNALPKNPNGSAVTIRAAITRDETVSPLLNTLGTLLLVGPLERGGAAVEIEAVDSETGKQVAALKFGYYPPLSDLAARFSRMSPGGIAVKKAAIDFSKLLAPSIVSGTVKP
jgi:Protein of unknown function (DUF3313)